MGFFSAVGSALSSIGSAVCSAVGSICSGIGGVLGRAGSVISDFASRIIVDGPIRFPQLDLPKIFEIIGTVVEKIAEFLGLKQPEQDNPEELGMKAEESDKKPEDFDSTEAYIEYLHNEVQLDKEKQRKLTSEEKMAYTTIGSHLYMKAAGEKLGVGEIAPEILMDSAKLNLDAKEIVSYIEKIRSAGINDTKAISDYLHGTFEKPGTALQVQDSMYEALKELYPEMSDEDIYSKLNEMKTEVRS